ncbi:MAG: phenylphosphate carboxylase subunit delta, partial [Nitrospirae bacterium]
MSGSARRPAAVRLVLLDVDGVLTDGRIVYDSAGAEAKAFHVRDGQRIK